MDVNLTIILIVMCIVILWLFVPLFGNTHHDTARQPQHPLDPKDSLLVQNYHIKPSYKKRVVLVIEEAQDNNIHHLISLIRNILTQDIKADSIVLISRNEDLKNIHIIRDTCIFNKIGGMTFLFKESGNHTIVIFIYPHGFNAFINSQFLKHLLETNKEFNGLTKVETNTINTSIDKVYHI